MADRTIDIIYRFMADTKSFERDMNKAVESNTAALEHMKPPSFEQLDKELRGANKEISRLVKTGQLTTEEGKKLKKELAGAKKEMAELARLHAQYVADHAEFVRLQQQPKVEPSRSGFAAGDPKVMDEYLQAVDRTFAQTKKKTTDLRDGSKATLATFSEFGREFVEGMHRGGAATAKATRQVQQFNKAANQSRVTIEEVGRAVMAKGFAFYGLRMAGASIAQQGQMAAMIGGGISGGMFKMAADYIKNLEGANETSREWAKQMQRVENSQKRIGAIMASETMPLLTKGADVLDKVAKYVEKNPEQVGMAMKAGLTLAGIGALVIALGKGITLFSDVAFVIATVNMLKGGSDQIRAAGMNIFSSQTNMKAAQLNAATAGKLTIGKYAPINPLAPARGATPVLTAGGAAGGGLVAALQSIAVALAALAGGAWLGDKIFDAIEGRDQKFGDYITTLKQALTVDAKALGDFFGKSNDSLFKKMFDVPEDLGDQWFKKVRDALFKVDEDSHGAADGLEGISDVLANSLKRDEVLKAWEDYVADDLALVRKHAEDRKKIEQDAIADTLKANQKFASDMRKIASRMGEQLANATRDYQQAEEKAERDYAEQRADIIRDGGEDIAEIERDLQERLRDLREEFAERQSEALAQRDAVALIKNRKKYLRDQSEAEREANREIAERRADMGRRLQELQVQHEQERNERLVEYQARIAEIQENARAEMEELRRQHAEELREIQLNRNNRLRELDLQLQEERNRRRDAFLAQVRDLDATLLGEENLRKQYQERMLKDLDAFLIRYRSGMGSLQTAITGSRQAGGYVTQGLYRLHSGEYVINPSTTRTLESLLGGQLTQAGLVQMGHSARTQVTWNDSRRFDSRLQPSDRRAIRDDTLEVLERVVVRR